VGKAGYGQHDANWLGFYDYFGRVTGLEACKKLDGMNRIARSSGWFWPFSGAVILTERPTELHRNDGGALHCETGPALRYPDELSIWSIDGVRVDEQIIMRPETQTIQQIDGEGNEEIKRVRIERFGWPRYIAETDAECLDTRRNDVDGTTEALVLVRDGSVRLLCACRSTGRVYAIGVPREIRKCVHAQNWMTTGDSNKSSNIIGAS
jgi:hypothetical protein